jgi:hypothetical protein
MKMCTLKSKCYILHVKEDGLIGSRKPIIFWFTLVTAGNKIKF